MTRLLALAPAILLAAVLAAAGCAGSGGSSRGTPSAPKPVVKIIERSVDGRADELTITSPALGRTAKATVLRPKGWTRGSQGWPALYLLHGCCGRGHDPWLTDGEADRLTARLKAVVIIPEGGGMGWYTDWKSGPAWETFHMAELRPLLEQEYGVGTRRAIAGYSMGGHGAMNYAARYPGVFEAAAAFSGVLDIRQNPKGFGDFLRGFGAEPTDIWGPEAEWSARNPADLVPKLKGIRLYVSCGDGRPETGGRLDATEESLLRENQTFVARAKAAGVGVKTDFYTPGTHTWPYWIRGLERALPTLLPNAIG